MCEFYLEIGDLRDPGTYTLVPTFTLVISLQSEYLSNLSKFQASPQIGGSVILCVSLIHISIQYMSFQKNLYTLWDLLLRMFKFLYCFRFMGG